MDHCCSPFKCTGRKDTTQVYRREKLSLSRKVFFLYFASNLLLPQVASGVFLLHCKYIYTFFKLLLRKIQNLLNKSRKFHSQNLCASCEMVTNIPDQKAFSCPLVQLVNQRTSKPIVTTTSKQ